MTRFEFVKNRTLLCSGEGGGIFQYNFEKVITFSKDFMLFQKLETFYYFVLNLIEKVKGLDVGQTLLE